MLAAAADILRVLQDPKPSWHLAGFGDSAINLELLVWINDPRNGIGSVKSNLCWGTWKRFQDHGIERPNPQGDVHIKHIPEITIRTGPEEV
jgi:small-conductance mechanosensitive channel